MIVPVLIGLAVLVVLLMFAYLVVFELRTQWRVWKIANRPQRAPGYIYDRDKDRLPL